MNEDTVSNYWNMYTATQYGSTGFKDAVPRVY